MNGTENQSSAEVEDQDMVTCFGAVGYELPTEDTSATNAEQQLLSLTREQAKSCTLSQSSENTLKLTRKPVFLHEIK